MLKPQDIVLLLKLLAHKEHLNWPQHQLASHLCISVSVVNASLLRLSKAGLLCLGINNKRYQPVIQACEEFLICGIKYLLPAKLGEYTRGLRTSYAAPIFDQKITKGDDPIPVWPTPEGDERGVALEPLYHCVPTSLIKYPDQEFYDLLSLIDAIRQGRARERNMAIKLLKDKLKRDNSK